MGSMSRRSTASRNALFPSVEGSGIPCSSTGSSLAALPRIALVGSNYALQKPIEQTADFRIVLIEHFSLQAKEQGQVAPQAIGGYRFRPTEGRQRHFPCIEKRILQMEAGWTQQKMGFPSKSLFLTIRP